MYNIMANFIKDGLWEIIKLNTTTIEQAWLINIPLLSEIEIMTTFVAAPRFLNKNTIGVIPEPANIQGEVNVADWTVVRTARVWILLTLASNFPDNFDKNLETLFDTAEMNEFVALYSALAFVPTPQKWLFRATEAVRSNMGVVFDAIAMGNPYPAKYFPEDAWNQLVLKTIFSDKPIHMVAGLKSRENAHLAATISDFAHERWAAGRTLAPEIWRLTSTFMNDTLLADMKLLFENAHMDNHKAAALACWESTFAPAHLLLNKYPELKELIQSGTLSWLDIEFKELNTYVPQP